MQPAPLQPPARHRLIVLVVVSLLVAALAGFAAWRTAAQQARPLPLLAP